MKKSNKLVIITILLISTVVLLIAGKYFYDKNVLVKINSIDKQISIKENEIRSIQQTHDNFEILIKNMSDAVDELTWFSITYSSDIIYLEEYYYTEISDKISNLNIIYIPNIRNLSFNTDEGNSIKEDCLNYLDKVIKFYESGINYLNYQNEIYYNQSISYFEEVQKFGKPTRDMMNLFEVQKNSLSTITNEVADLVAKKVKLQRFLWLK